MGTILVTIIYINKHDSRINPLSLSLHLHKTIVKSMIITKSLLGILPYMVQNEVDKFTIDIHSKFDITLNYLM